MNKELFLEELKKINIEPTENQLKQLDIYYQLLVDWNEKINLTTIIEEQEAYLKHFYDSLTISKVINLNDYESLCDIGTGAGFPGLVLKIFYPHLKIILVDSLFKRIKFLDKVIETLKLKNILTVHARIEDYAKLNREKYDIVTARAVTNLPILLEYAIPLLKINKYFIALKGEVEEELSLSKTAFNKLNCLLEKKVSFTLPVENSNRSILKIKKTGSTSLKYPRSIKEIRTKAI